LTAQLGYDDTWHVGVGAEVQLSEPWRLQFGIAYDSSMTDDSNRSLSLSLASQLRLGLGAQVAVDPHWGLGFATEFLWGGSPRVDVDRGPLSGHVSGRYGSTWLLFTNFSFTWKGCLAPEWRLRPVFRRYSPLPWRTPSRSPSRTAAPRPLRPAYASATSSRSPSAPAWPRRPSSPSSTA